MMLVKTLSFEERNAVNLAETLSNALARLNMSSNREIDLVLDIFDIYKPLDNASAMEKLAFESFRSGILANRTDLNGNFVPPPKQEQNENDCL